MCTCKSDDKLIILTLVGMRRLIHDIVNLQCGLILYKLNKLKLIYIKAYGPYTKLALGMAPAGSNTSNDTDLSIFVTQLVNGT